MSDETELLEDTVELSGAGKGGKMKSILIVLIGLGVGAGGGFTALGDPMGAILAARAQAPDQAGDDGHGGGGGGGHGAPAGPQSAIHMIENLVLNPARSGGSRFLLVSIAIEAADPDDVDLLDAREMEIRSALNMLLGAKTIDELGNEHLPTIVAEVEAAIVEIMGPGVVHRVLIPQFVLQ